MNTITTWNPFRELNELSNRLLGTPASGDGCAWRPSVDISEDSAGYTIHADLPRVDKDHVKVTFADGVLSIEGERHSEEKSDETKVHLIERSYGRFVRSFRLPEDADGSGIAANFKDGVLTVAVPKREETKPKSIEINVN